ncbi:sigma-70 family RNA polymerase sigma factor [Paenibacillaceae bacterium]|nr:sigma-70 family RNA polymerase sigma factor [Paenibacillaceae bacterium]
MPLEELYKVIQPKIYAFFYVNTADRELSEDLTHEVFYQAIKGLHTFTGASSLQTWIFAIARNILYNHYRSKKYRQQLAGTLADRTGAVISAEQQAITNESLQLLAMNIQQLDQLPREIVIMRIYGELSFKEIAQLIGKSENYARVMFHRAKMKLQEKLEGIDG